MKRFLNGRRSEEGSSDWQRPPWILKHLNFLCAFFYVFHPRFFIFLVIVIHFYSCFCVINTLVLSFTTFFIYVLLCVIATLEIFCHMIEVRVFSSIFFPIIETFLHWELLFLSLFVKVFRTVPVVSIKLHDISFQVSNSIEKHYATL